MESDVALQAEEDFVYVHNLVDQEKTSVTIYTSLGGDHCGYENCGVYSTLQHQDKSLDHLYLKHSIWSSVLSSTTLLSIEYIRSNF